jgi:hypothetical protein
MEPAMSSIAEDQDTLQQDSSFDEPLRRVAYEAGMMLGLEATRDEQAYHRRRLTRQQYWLHGAGTVVGMLVSVEAVSSEGQPPGVRVLVGPGVGLDGLGREVVVHEPYCIDLGEWLAAQGSTSLAEGHDNAADLLWLRVTVRYKDCAVAAQPVLARKLNMSTDPVQASRLADSILLEMEAELPPSGQPAYRPWPMHGAIPEDLPPGLSADETATINAASGAGAEQLRLGARLLHALGPDGLTPQGVAAQVEERARLLLARIALPVPDIDNITPDAATARVNNLVRPFVTTAGQLAHLARQQP